METREDMHRVIKPIDWVDGEVLIEGAIMWTRRGGILKLFFFFF